MIKGDKLTGQHFQERQEHKQGGDTRGQCFRKKGLDIVANMVLIGRA